MELSDTEKETLKTILETEKFKFEDFLKFPKLFHWPIHNKQSIQAAENHLKNIKTILNKLN